MISSELVVIIITETKTTVTNEKKNKKNLFKNLRTKIKRMHQLTNERDKVTQQQNLIPF